MVHGRARRLDQCMATSPLLRARPWVLVLIMNTAWKTRALKLGDAAAVGFGAERGC